MSWKSILKSEEYSFYLTQIERLEEMLEQVYEGIENTAIKIVKKTPLSLEEARKIVKTTQQDSITLIETTIAEKKQRLEDSISNKEELQ